MGGEPDRSQFEPHLSWPEGALDSLRNGGLGTSARPPRRRTVRRRGKAAGGQRDHADRVTGISKNSIEYSSSATLGATIDATRRVTLRRDSTAPRDVPVPN